jgi:hypothetical protein
MSVYDDFLAWDRVLWNRVAIAVPELMFEEDYVQYAVRNGWIDSDAADEWKRRMRAFKKTAKVSKAVYEGNGVLGRILELMPEVLSIRTVDWLRSIKINGRPLIDATTGNILRAVLSGSKQLTPMFAKDATFLARVESLFGALTTSHILNTIRDLDDAQIASIRRGMLIGMGKDPWNGRLDSENAAIIRQMLEVSVRRTQIARSVVSTGRVLQGTWKEVAAQRDIWSRLSIVFDDLFANDNADKILRNAIRAGAIPQDKYELIRAFGKAGVNLWKKGVHASDYDSWVARTLIVGEGVLSSEMLNLLVQLKIIDPRAADALRPLMHLSRVVLRANLENYMVNTRFRVRPGESAIQTYARLTTRTDGEVLRLLAAAAKDTERTIAAEMGKPGFGKKTQVAQQRQILTSIHGGMKSMWENVGSLTIFGEKQAAQAALEATTFMMETAYANSGREAEELMRSLRYQARAGIDAFISREENILQLSRRVYQNIPYSMGQVQKEIKKGLIRQLSARDLAANVRDMIRPDVQGGVSYAAMRLARTEINNAFHFSQIRYTREMPWVEGYKWNKSRSHGAVDVCDTRAQKNHEGLGRGVYSKKNVPGKAHPQCLCFLTTVTADRGKFEKRLRSGAYDKFLNQAEDGNFGVGFEQPPTVREAGADFIRDGGKIMSKAVGLVFLNSAEQLYKERMQNPGS